MRSGNGRNGRDIQCLAPQEVIYVHRHPPARLAEFEQLMRKHNRMLFRTGRASLRDDAESRDALQEACLRGAAHSRADREDTLFPRAQQLREALSQEIDLAIDDAFAFAGERCDRIVAHVMDRLAAGTGDPS